MKGKRLRPTRPSLPSLRAHTQSTAEIRTGLKALISLQPLLFNSVSLLLSLQLVLHKFMGGKVVGVGEEGGVLLALLSVQQAPAKAGSAWPAQGAGLAARSRGCGEKVCTQHLLLF